MQTTDVLIIGGGILGLATAYNLVRTHPGVRLVLVEKEDGLARHQTGHNSGVLHSGIYYTPGSLKAVNCREGKKAMEAFCREHDIPHEICGKVIVAVDDSERPALRRILERGRANGVRCEIIGTERLRELEPHAAGAEAIHVPEAGIVDYRRVCAVLARLVEERGARIVFNAQVTAMDHREESIVVRAGASEIEARHVVNCGGLYSDKLTALSGQRPEAQIVPFRGEYFEILPEAHHLCRNLIYPVPDPSFPFLGVHFTRMIGGGVECGPNAVLAFAREGYGRTDLDLSELVESLTYPGFIRLALRYWRVGAGEMWRSWSKHAFVAALQRLVPEIQSRHLAPAHAGIRAQALRRDGSLVDDFLIQDGGRVVNVCNAPSPGATASLNIGRLVVEKLAARF